MFQLHEISSVGAEKSIVVKICGTGFSQRIREKSEKRQQRENP